MKKNNLLSVFILMLTGILTVAPCFLSGIIAQDRIPACPPLNKTLKKIKPLREMTWANDTISAQISIPFQISVPPGRSSQNIRDFFGNTWFLCNTHFHNSARLDSATKIM